MGSSSVLQQSTYSQAIILSLYRSWEGTVYVYSKLRFIEYNPFIRFYYLSKLCAIRSYFMLSAILNLQLKDSDGEE